MHLPVFTTVKPDGKTDEEWDFEHKQVENDVPSTNDDSTDLELVSPTPVPRQVGGEGQVDKLDENDAPIENGSEDKEDDFHQPAPTLMASPVPLRRKLVVDMIDAILTELDRNRYDIIISDQLFLACGVGFGGVEQRLGVGIEIDDVGGRDIGVDVEENYMIMFPNKVLVDARGSRPKKVFADVPRFSAKEGPCECSLVLSKRRSSRMLVGSQPKKAIADSRKFSANEEDALGSKPMKDARKFSAKEGSRPMKILVDVPSSQPTRSSRMFVGYRLTKILVDVPGSPPTEVPANACRFSANEVYRPTKVLVDAHTFSTKEGHRGCSQVLRQLRSSRMLTSSKPKKVIADARNFSTNEGHRDACRFSTKECPHGCSQVLDQRRSLRMLVGYHLKKVLTDARRFSTKEGPHGCLQVLGQRRSLRMLTGSQPKKVLTDARRFSKTEGPRGFSGSRPKLL
ncbi:hypothetical protein JRO89_XS12G0161500 [Xanthoceras sorbifolium]|uniref:Uncharacterized protein n=1 Tax=Xanthoceras sorbifolium TaxID=99658 RepID=A0ABQ8HCW0_9ROSI|nr:hypothetical protein JRO89_XS12G0161500 [Xanthoceras sorbifolium]